MKAAAPWTDLGGDIRVRQSVAFQMNSTVLFDREHAVLVDPGVLASELDDLARVVREAESAALTLVFTHAHWDHVLGLPWWPGADTLAHDRCAAALRSDAKRILREIETLATSHGESWTRGFVPFRPSREVSGLHFARLGPWRLVFRDAPGHCASQLTLHLPDRGVLIAADMLSDIEIPTLDGPCAPYLRTLRDLLPLAENGAIETLIPGHGSIAHGRDAVLGRLRRDLDYLERLEREVGKARRAGLSREGARERLSEMDTGGGKMEDSALEDHLQNVILAYDGLVSAGPGPRSRARRS